MNQYAVLQAWESFKSAALASGLPITEALPRFALEKWAEAAADRPGSPGRAMREAVTASIVGAALTDIAIDKLAAEGAYTEPEREYLRQLNAEAALGDLGFLFKSALSLDPFRNYPKLTGGVVGGMLGAGFGAWKDEDNRVRGALAYGVPGAAIGALGGHLYEGHKERVTDLLKKEREEQAARDLTARMNDRKIQALEEDRILHGIQRTRQLIDDPETDDFFATYGPHLVDHFKTHGLDAPLSMGLQMEIDRRVPAVQAAIKAMLNKAREYARLP